jgi:hypothetical protein
MAQVMEFSDIINCTGYTVVVSSDLSKSVDATSKEPIKLDEGIFYTESQQARVEYTIPPCDFSNYNYRKWCVGNGKLSTVMVDIGRNHECQVPGFKTLLGISIIATSVKPGVTHHVDSFRFNIGPIEKDHPIFSTLSTKAILVTGRTLEVICALKIKREGPIFYIQDYLLVRSHLGVVNVSNLLMFEEKKEQD